MGYCSAPMNAQGAIRLLIFAGLTANVLAKSTEQNSANSSEPVLATKYFIWWSTWVGNAFGLADLFGWLLDWITNYKFYYKGQSKEVTRVQDGIAALKKERHEWRKEEIGVALNSCDIIIKYFKDPDSGLKEEDVIACLEPISKAMQLEAEISDDDEESEPENEGGS